MGRFQQMGNRGEMTTDIGAKRGKKKYEGTEGDRRDGRRGEEAVNIRMGWDKIR